MYADSLKPILIFMKQYSVHGFWVKSDTTINQ